VDNLEATRHTLERNGVALVVIALGLLIAVPTRDVWLSVAQTGYPASSGLSFNGGGYALTQLWLGGAVVALGLISLGARQSLVIWACSCLAIATIVVGWIGETQLSKHAKAVATNAFSGNGFGVGPQLTTSVHLGVRLPQISSYLLVALCIVARLRHNHRTRNWIKDATSDANVGLGK
jgi:hypothetical protein